MTIPKEEANLDSVAKAVQAERQRCVDILNAARAHEIDTDLRCIRDWIESGDVIPAEVKGRG